MGKVIKGKLASIIGVKVNHRIVNVVTGVRGSGKTKETKNIIKRYVKKFPKEKVLILDDSNEYTDYKKIELQQIKTFKKPSRIDLSKYKSNISSVVVQILNGFKGLLVIEAQGISLQVADINQFNLISLLTLNRTNDIDAIIISSSLKNIHPKIIQNTSCIRFHKDIETGESIRRNPRYSFANIGIPIDVVNNNSNSFAFCYFDLENNKIIGANVNDIYFAFYNFFKPQIVKCTYDMYQAEPKPKKEKAKVKIKVKAKVVKVKSKVKSKKK